MIYVSGVACALFVVLLVIAATVVEPRQMKRFEKSFIRSDDKASPQWKHSYYIEQAHLKASHSPKGRLFGGVVALSLVAAISTGLLFVADEFHKSSVANPNQSFDLLDLLAGLDGEDGEDPATRFTDKWAAAEYGLANGLHDVKAVYRSRCLVESSIECFDAKAITSDDSGRRLEIIQINVVSGVPIILSKATGQELEARNAN